MTYSIVKSNPATPDQVEVVMSGLSDGKEEGYKFRPNFELKCLREQRKTYYNENCTEVTDWCFNVTETPSNGSTVLMNYRIIEVD